MDYNHWLALLDEQVHSDDAPLADRSSLVDRLAPAFAAHRRRGTDFLNHALVPVVHHTHQLHDAVRDTVFPSRADGLALLADASLRFENDARRDMTAAHAVYDDAKRSLDSLFSALDALVRQGDLLFDAFKTDMHEHVQRLRLSADQMPVDAERLVSSLQKQARHLGAEDHAKAKENLLRGILEKY